jgi:26S proteasome regulatory subunit N7
MATRDFRKAATLFLDSLSTFTASELCSYNQFVFYTVVTAVVALDRVALKQKVVDTPEILAVLGQLPHVERFLNGLYTCKYKARAGRAPACARCSARALLSVSRVPPLCVQEFMVAFPGVADAVRADMHLHKHFRYFLREARVTAYTQARWLGGTMCNASATTR